MIPQFISLLYLLSLFPQLSQAQAENVDSNASTSKSNVLITIDGKKYEDFTVQDIRVGELIILTPTGPKSIKYDNLRGEDARKYFTAETVQKINEKEELRKRLRASYKKSKEKEEKEGKEREREAREKTKKEDAISSINNEIDKIVDIYVNYGEDVKVFQATAAGAMCDLGSNIRIVEDLFTSNKKVKKEFLGKNLCFVYGLANVKEGDYVKCSLFYAGKFRYINGLGVDRTVESYALTREDARAKIKMDLDINEALLTR